MILLDTCAWIEYFMQTIEGERVKKLVETEKTATAVVTLAELKSWALKNGKSHFELAEFAQTASEVLALTPDISKKAGEIHYETRKTQPTFGMIDAMIYATAMANGLQLLTGDKDFAGKPGVVML